MISESKERGSCDGSCNQACCHMSRIFRDFQFFPVDFASVERLHSSVVAGGVALIGRIFRALLESVCEGFELLGTDGLDLRHDGKLHTLSAWGCRE